MMIVGGAVVEQARPLNKDERTVSPWSQILELLRWEGWEEEGDGGWTLRTQCGRVVGCVVAVVARPWDVDDRGHSVS